MKRFHVHVSFAISRRSEVRGVEDVGIQVENSEELQEVYARLQKAGVPVLEEGATTCCYAHSEKSWITDPQGLPWETFLTTGEGTVYGRDREEVVSAIPETSACCAPGCCAPQAAA
jgi:hypothetical protein